MIALLVILVAAPVVQWETRYDGPGSREDTPSAMVADSSGSAWVAGYSYVPGSDFQFTVAGFSPSGELRWVNRYGSPLGSEDRAWAIARDSAGCLVATGGTLADLSVGWDFLTAKYTPDGDTLWLRRLDLAWHADDKPAAVAIAPGDCPVIAGAAHRPAPRADWDIAVVKYSPGGDTLWARYWDGAASADDFSASLAVGGGAIYVAGKTVTARPATDIVLLKFTLDGTLAWSRTIDGPAGSTDFAAQVAYRAGRIYVGGTVTGSGTAYDWCVAAFDTAGRRLWTHLWDGEGRGDILESFCFDSSGSVIAVGQSAGASTGVDAAVLKLDSAGRRLWSRRYNGERNSSDRAWRVAAGKNNDITVAANSVGSGGFPELVLLGFSSSGDTLWSWRRADPATGEARPVGLALLPARGTERAFSELLCTSFAFSEAAGFDWLLLRLDPAGSTSDTDPQRR
ncbi:MAG: hypothetical protein R6X13_01135 [bacterium]